MAGYEPNALELLITALAGRLFVSIYRDYIDRLNLRGNERVLDFGSGGGTPARMIAERLLVGGGTLTCVDVSERWMRLLERRLRRFPNVKYYLGPIAEQPIPPQSQEIVLVHFVLHDIAPDERPDTVRQLASRLVAQGRLCLREPLAQLTLEETNALVQAAGLVEVEERVGDVPIMGRTFEAVYCKTGEPQP